MRKTSEYSGSSLQLAAWLLLWVILLLSQARAQTPDPHPRCAIQPCASSVESISFRAELEFSHRPFEAHEFLRSCEVHPIRRRTPEVSFAWPRTPDRIRILRQADLFALKPVEDNLNLFDDAPEHQKSVWGTYFTVPSPIMRQGHADLYYIGLDTKSVSYNRGTARKSRQTAGVRAFRPIAKGLDYNWEGNIQWGAFGNNSNRAWSASTETGYTFDHLRFHPRPLLRADVNSVDGSPSGHALGTFNSLFPRGAYFTPKAFPFLGPQNLIGLDSVVLFQLKQNITSAFA
jgi:hypothetical protein